jgi:FG-GAP-like repeat
MIFPMTTVRLMRASCEGIMADHGSDFSGKVRCRMPFRHLRGNLLTVALAIVSGCTGSSSPDTKPGPASGLGGGEGAVGAVGSIPPEPEHLITFCSACHVMPLPASFPRVAWYEEVRRGFNFYYDSGRTDLQVPVQSEVVAWFREQAPTALPEADLQHQPHAVSFRRAELSFESPAPDQVTAISFLDIVEESPSAGSGARRVIEKSWPGVASNPAAVRQADLDGNGLADLIIADLGSLLPADHDRGQLVWLPDARAELAGPPVNLLPGVGRVADVRTADFDADGDIDLVAAEFGWHQTGGIHVLWNQGPEYGTRPERFRAERLDQRPGTIHLPVTDLNGDGRPDFVALISQEHEVIDAFLNRESGFERVRLYAAPDPAFGSSGLELVDFDGDGDTDLLYTNGDTFDSNLIKPYHGIRLLKNQGQLRFEDQRIADLPGVHRALAADVDQDGDQDLIAAALLPEASIQNRDVSALQAVIWLEQTGPGQFSRHVVDWGRPSHAAAVIVDFDGDGAVDLLTGSFNDRVIPGDAGLQLRLSTGLKTADR